MSSPTPPDPSFLDRNELEFLDSTAAGVQINTTETCPVTMDGTSIASRALLCQAKLNTLLHALEARGETRGDELSVLAVEDQVGRFRLWAGNIGAFQEGRSSLDYRLRDAKFMAQNVQRLLDSLQVAAGKGIPFTISQRHLRSQMRLTNIIATDAASTPSPPIKDAERSGSLPSDYETSSDSSGGADLVIPAKTELAEHYLTITEIIGRLFKLSIVIRSSSIQTAAATSASFVEKDEYSSNVSVLFEQYIVQRIVHHYPDLSPRIAERLSRAISRRRRQFMYQRRHRKKLGRVPASVKYSSRNPAQITESGDAGLALPTSMAGVSDGPAPTVFHHSIISDTTASQYIPRPEQTDTVSMKSFSAASSDFKGSDIDIPPPVSPYNDEEFECPYCFFILSRKFKKKRAWRYFNGFLIEFMADLSGNMSSTTLSHIHVSSKTAPRQIRPSPSSRTGFIMKIGRITYNGAVTCHLISCSYLSRRSN